MDAPFDQTNIGLRERPVSADLNQSQSQIYRSIRETLRSMLSTRIAAGNPATAAISGFIGDGLRVVPSSPAAMSVQVTQGMGFAYNATDVPTNIGATDLGGVTDLAAWKPLPLLAPVTFSTPAAPGSPNSRIDIIEVRYDRRLENSITREQLDSGSLAFMDHVFNKTLAFALDGRTGVVNDPSPSTAGLSYKIGTAANPGLVPATTAGYVKIAEINVLNTTTSVDGNCLVDRRPLLAPGGVHEASIRFRLQYNSGTPIVTIRDLIAPPGILLSVATRLLDTTFPSAECLVYALGGEIAHCSVSASAYNTPNQQPLFARARLDKDPTVGGQGYNVLDQGNQGFQSPAITAGLTMKCVVADVAWWDLNAGAFSNTTGNARDAEVTVSFKLGY